MRRAVLTGAAAALTAAVAGCGGSGSDRLSVSQYKTQAERICTDSARQTNALGRPKTTSQFKTFLTKGIRVTERNLRRFAALRPPDNLQSRHQAILAAERRGLVQLRRVSVKLHGDSRDVALLRRVQPELSRISADTSARYRAAGLTACTRA